ncbi:MAG: hypothetical protein II038_03760 [Lachnospiraceae bacterium]|nr:hypothetical protein [Lachnospiraceae bacterium]
MSENAYQNRFVVRYSRKGLWLEILTFIAVEAIAVCLAVFLHNCTAGIVLGLAYALFGGASIVTSVLFHVKVENSLLSVRSMGRKKYAFPCREIEQITCSKRGSIRNGPSFYISLISGDCSITFSHDMDGFQRIARYLLDRLNAGEIPGSAASASCRSELSRYAAGEIYRKKKN